MTNQELAQMLGKYAAEAQRRQAEAMGLLIQAIYSDLATDDE